MFSQIKKNQKILAIGAHSDDIEIGCLGTLLRLKQNHSSQIFYYVLCNHEAKRKEESFLSCKMSDIKNNISIFKYPDKKFPYFEYDIQKDIEKIINQINPDIIFYPNNDTHQDHEIVSISVQRIKKKCHFFKYEIINNNNFYPNFFIKLDQTFCFNNSNKIYRNSFFEFIKKNNIKNNIASYKCFIFLKSMTSQSEKPYYDIDFLINRMKSKSINLKFPSTCYVESFEGRILI